MKTVSAAKKWIFITLASTAQDAGASAHWIDGLLALVGLVVYWVVKLISPGTARRVKDMISGERSAGGDL